MKDGYFWRGPITSRAQAVRITRITAGWIGSFTAISALSAIFKARGLVDTMIAMVIVAASVALYRKQSLAASRFLFGCSIFSVVVCFGGFGALAFTGGESPVALTLIFVFGLLWLLPLFATLRSSRAAKYLRQPTALKETKVLHLS